MSESFSFLRRSQSPTKRLSACNKVGMVPLFMKFEDSAHHEVCFGENSRQSYVRGAHRKYKDTFRAKQNKFVNVIVLRDWVWKSVCEHIFRSNVK